MPDLKQRTGLSQEHLLASHLLYGLAALENVHVPLSKYIALAYIAEHEGATITAISDMLGLAGSSGTRIVQRLEETGMITTEVDEDDHRVKHLQMTAEGHRLLEQFGHRQYETLCRMVRSKELDISEKAASPAAQHRLRHVTPASGDYALASHLLYSLRDLGDIQVPVTKFIALAYIAEHEGVNVTKLARVMDVADSSGTRIVQRLEESGIVRTTASLDDSRRRQIELTDKGHTLLDDYGAKLHSMIAEMVGRGELPCPGDPQTDTTAVEESGSSIDVARIRRWRGDDAKSRRGRTKR